MSTKTIAPECVRFFAGTFGHAWHVTAIDGAGRERLCSYVNSGEDAYRHWHENGEQGHIYQRNGRRGNKWKRVRPSLASIS